MADYQFSSDLVDAILFTCDEPTDGTSDFEAKALEYLNRAYLRLCSGGSELDQDVDEVWWWLRAASPGILTLLPQEAVTATLTNNSTAVTLAGAPSKNLLGQIFRVTGHPDVYRVAAHSGTSTSLTLDGVFTGTTGSYAANVQQIEYNLSSSVLKMFSPMRSYRQSNYRIIGMDADQMDLEWPLGIMELGMPQAFAMVSERTVRFSHCVTEMSRVEYDYLTFPTMLTNSGAEEPLVPRQFRSILSDYGAMWLMKDKEDDRFETQASIAQKGLQAMRLEQRRRAARQSKPGFGRIYTRPTNGDRTGPLRTSSGLIIG